MILRRLSERIAPLMLGLALWMALPSFEWCPFSWAECQQSCDASQPIACETASSCDPVCNAMSACGAGSEASEAKTCALPCDPTPDSSPLGDRAWCVHPPVEALIASSVEIQAPAALPVLAILAPPLDLEPPIAETSRSATAVFQPPVLIAPHAPPLGRAPPPFEPGTRS